LVAAGHAPHEIERAGVHHIAVGKPKLDWSALIDREKAMIKDIPGNLARAMEKRGQGDPGPSCLRTRHHPRRR
jgi:glutathione reductase (NADPH)